MRFGLFHAHHVPRPGAAGDEEPLVRDALEQVALGERLRFDPVWASEHHFLVDRSHDSASGRGGGGPATWQRCAGA